MGSTWHAMGCTAVDDAFLTCKKCSYDLRARERARPCPECGHWPYNSVKREYKEPGSEAIYHLCLGVSIIAGFGAFASLIGLPQELAWSLTSDGRESSWARYMLWDDRLWVALVITVLTAPCWIYVLARLAYRSFEEQRHRERQARGFPVDLVQRQE